MKKTALMSVAVGLVLAMAASTGWASALTTAADKLVADQLSVGDWTDGSWPAEANFAGESTIGLVHAYQMTNDIAYKTAAENAGAYSLEYAGYNASNGGFANGLYPAEMYAMAQLSKIQPNPSDNYWRTALIDNLEAVDAAPAVTWYKNNADSSSAVYDVSRIAVAANYVNHSSKTTWRNGVISLLSDVDDNAAAPVMALGAAVWALSTTGDISADTRDIWTNAEVKDLPGKLVDLQAPDNSFYTKFDTTQGSGFTETTVMGALGLIAANASSPSYSYSFEIDAVAGVLESGVRDHYGDVYWQIDVPSHGEYYFVIGETLEVVTSPDYDYSVFVAEFGQTGPTGALKADYDQNGRVDLDDFAILRKRLEASVASPPLDETPEAVPEPAVISILALGALAVLRKRRKR